MEKFFYGSSATAKRLLQARGSESNLLNILVRNAKADAVFGILCVFLLFAGLNTTRGLEWPYDLDHYRDIAQTQTILDGAYGSDPYYLNEKIWYNPGSHFLIGGISLLLNIEVPKAEVRLGFIMNLLPLIAFYVMLRIMLGWQAALISTAAYVFIHNPYPVWASSLYSPWFFPGTFSQAFFYIALTLFYLLVKKNREAKYYAAVGIFLGVAFLFHTAPALIGAGVIVLFLLGKTAADLKNPDPGIYPFKILLKKSLYLLIPALMISMIFLYFIIWHYRLKILNPMPCSWQWDQLTIETFPSVLTGEFLNISGLIAVFGAVHLLTRKKDAEIKNIFVSWLTVCLGCLGYSLLKTNIKALTPLPSIIPAFHFFFYLKALSYVFFGCGVVSIARVTWKALKDNVGFMKKIEYHASNRRFQAKAVIYMLIIALLSTYILYAYPRDKKIVESRNVSLSRMSQNHLINAYYWIRQNTGENDVFLCSNHFSMKAVAPAGRKVVATNVYFSNPYVDFKKRKNDRLRMFKNLKTGDIGSFSRLCKKYNTRYVIETVSLFGTTHNAYRKYLTEVFRSGDVVIARIDFDGIHSSPGKFPGEAQKIRGPQ
jgi:hypothetical protein